MYIVCTYYYIIKYIILYGIICIRCKYYISYRVISYVLKVQDPNPNENLQFLEMSATVQFFPSYTSFAARPQINDSQINMLFKRVVWKSDTNTRHNSITGRQLKRQKIKPTRPKH